MIRLAPFLYSVVLAAFCLARPAPAAAFQTTAEPPTTVSPMEAIREGTSEALEEDELAELSADLDALFAFAYAQDGPGAAALVVRDGEVLLRGGYGMADLELGVAIEPDMVFRIGSVTKQFTAVALLMLVEEGKLALEDPITRFLHDYPTGGNTITLHHLLTHVSGIQSYTAMENFLDDVEENFSVSEMVARFQDEPMEFAPGEDYAYNNSAYFLLGAVIEKASGKSYEQFLQERIFTPLEMDQSYYGGHAKIVPRRVSGYGGQPGGYRNAPYLSMTQPYSAGALLSTVNDLAKWDAALYTEKLVSQELLERAWTAAALNDGRSVHYGYGWSVDEYEGYRVLRHGGGIPGFATHVVRIPEAKIFVAVLSNNPGMPPGPHELAFRAAVTALGKPLEARPRAQLDSELLDEYVGLYEIEDDPENYRLVKREGDQLFTQRRRGQSFPIYAGEKDRFFYADSPGTFRFVRDEGGEVVGTTWQDGGGPAEQASKTDREPPAQPRAIELDPALLEDYTGAFVLRGGPTLTVSRDGNALFIQVPGQAKLPIEAETETRFFVEGAPIGLEFIPGDDGVVRELVLQQGVRETRGDRKKE